MCSHPDAGLNESRGPRPDSELVHCQGSRAGSQQKRKRMCPLGRRRSGSDVSDVTATREREVVQGAPRDGR